MVQDRIKRWNQGKNVNKHQMESIIRRLSIREAVNKRSEIRVNKRPVQMDKIRRYRRRNMIIPRIEVDRMKSPTPPGVEICTPPTSPLSMSRLPGLLEKIMKYKKDFILGSLDKKIWDSVSDLEHLKLKSEAVNTSDCYQESKGTFNLFVAGRPGEIERLLMRAHTGMEDFIKNQREKPTTAFFICVHQYAFLGKLDLMMPKMERYAASLGQILDPSHPITQACRLSCQYLREAENDEKLEAIKTICMSTVGSFEKALGSLHRSTLAFRFALIRHVVFPYNFEYGLSILRKILDECDNDCRGPADLRPLQARVCLADGLTDARCQIYHEAADIAEEIIKRTKRQGFPQEWVATFQRQAEYYLGICEMARENVGAGEHHFRNAIRIAVADCGAGDAAIVGYENKLKDWLQRHGRLGRTTTADEFGM